MLKNELDVNMFCQFKFLNLHALRVLIMNYSLVRPAFMFHFSCCNFHFAFH
jgi:hypothetical protein